MADLDTNIGVIVPVIRTLVEFTGDIVGQVRLYAGCVNPNVSNEEEQTKRRRQ